MRNALVIMNPIAGARWGARTPARIRKRLKENEIEAEIIPTTQRGDAETIAREKRRDYDLVVAAGGDGTVNEVASGLLETETPLGILPLGTANVFARDIGIPLSLKGASGVLAAGAPRAVDVGRARFRSEGAERIFLCMAGVGLDADAAHAYKSVRGTSSRYHQYVVPIFQSIRDFRFPNIRVSIEGRHLPQAATSVIVGNIRTYGGPFRPTPRARVDDGLLDVCAVSMKNMRDLLRCIWGIMGGRHLGYRQITYAVGREVCMESKGPVRVQLDGDAVGWLPAHLSIAPGGLTVIAPRSD